MRITYRILFCFLIAHGSMPLLAFETGDSTRYLTLKDTIFLSINEAGEKIFEHVVEKSQTLYSLARFYGLNMEELYPYNPDLKSNVLSPGMRIVIPIPNRAINRYKTKEFKAWKYVKVFYIVQKGDNLYRIAKVHFHMPVDSIVARNKLPSEVVSEGQKLQVGWMSLNGIPDSLRVVATAKSPWGKSAELKHRFGLEQTQKVTEAKGVAFWQKNGRQNTDLYCLHRTAPLNSVVAVTNPAKNRTVFAKVIGRIPDNAYGDDVQIIISPTLAKMLAAVDERFYVKLKYYEKSGAR